MNNILFIVVMSFLVIYLVARQFMQQPVTWTSLLLLPAASAYSSYLDFQAGFSKFAPLPLVAGLIVGALIGVAVGAYRSKYTQVFVDTASNRIVSKPQLRSSGMWLGQLIVRVAIGVLSYSPLGQHSLLIGVASLFISGLFLVSIVTQKFMLYTQYKALQQKAAASNNLSKDGLQQDQTSVYTRS